MKRHVKIVGVGKYLPTRKVASAELEQEQSLPPGSISAMTGVETRYYVEDETSSQMGALAARKALKSATIEIAEIDCIVYASAAMEQPVPCTAALIQLELGAHKTGIPCFDINATCLSFVTALDILSCSIEVGRYEKVLIISSEIVSTCLNREDKNTAFLFGDGAAAVVLTKSAPAESSAFIASSMETYSEGAQYSTVSGGGTKLHPKYYNEQTCKNYFFRMEGGHLHKLASKVLPGFIDSLLKNAEITIDEFAVIIPHQASMAAMKLIEKRLQAKPGSFFYTIQHYGNTVAASIPMALCDAIEQGRINRGDKVLLLGIAAGLSLGAIVVEF